MTLWWRDDVSQNGCRHVAKSRGTSRVQTYNGGFSQKRIMPKTKDEPQVLRLLYIYLQHSKSWLLCPNDMIPICQGQIMTVRYCVHYKVKGIRYFYRWLLNLLQFEKNDKENLLHPNFISQVLAAWCPYIKPRGSLTTIFISWVARQ